MRANFKWDDKLHPKLIKAPFKQPNNLQTLIHAATIKHHNIQMNSLL